MKNGRIALQHFTEVALSRKRAQRIVYLALLLLFLFLTFYRLDQAPIRNWDEARHGISAYEMLQSGNYVINTYRYDKDLWNLKPPLSFWMIAASFKALGYCVLALRIPSAICFTLIFLLIAGHMHKRYGFTSTVAYMVLFLSYSDLFLSHFGRSADADALYNLLVVGAVLALFRSNQSKRYDWWLYLSGFLASLAFLSKSFHAVAVYVIIAANAILRKELRSVRIYAKLAIAAFFPIFIWMVMRFFADGFDFLGSMFGVDVVDRIHSFQAEIQTEGAVSIIHYLLHYRPSQILLIIIVFSGTICLIDAVEKETLLNLVHNQDVWLYSLWFLFPHFVF